MALYDRKNNSDSIITIQQVNHFIKSEKLDIKEIEHPNEAVSILFEIIVALNERYKEYRRNVV